MNPGDIPRAVLERLPIFPLPDVVLFPNALLPLHVFEPRYRELIRHVLALRPRVFAVPRLRPGYQGDDYGRPAVYGIAGIGVCLSIDRLADGRFNVLLHGLGRVRIEAELPPERVFRLVRGRLLLDAPAGPEIEAVHLELIALCDRLAAAVDDGAALRQLARAVGSPGGCADVVGAALVRDPDARQSLLELLDPADRLDRVIEHVSDLIAHVARAPDGNGLN